MRGDPFVTPKSRKPRGVCEKRFVRLSSSARGAWHGTCCLVVSRIAGSRRRVAR
jgi:hypothetical protein